MGTICSYVFDRLFATKQVRVLLLGLDAAGKTTILYALKLGEVETTIPTIGYNVETQQHKNINFTSWDMGGCQRVRPLWHHFYQNTQGLIFVVDSNDRDRMSCARDELDTLLSEEELRDSTLLVFANKQDLPNAMTPEEITHELGLEHIRDREWFIQSSSAKTGEGLHEGLNWLLTTIKTNM